MIAEGVETEAQRDWLAKRALVLPRASFLLAHSLLKSRRELPGRKVATPN